MPVPATKIFAKCLVSRIERARSCLDAAPQRADLNYNLKRKDATFLLGHLVMLSTKHLRGQLTGPRKLLPRWVGPYTVVRMVGSVAIEIQLPSEFHIRSTFHISLLRPYHGKAPVITVKPGTVAYEDKMHFIK